jgi:large subunit ribosomal protein L25
MKTIEIKGILRKELGKKSSREIRKSGNIPCVVYSKEGNIHFSAGEKNFKGLIYTNEAHLVKLNIDGNELRAILKDAQFHPVTDRIIHADFIQIHDDKPVIIDIPVKVTGNSAGVLEGGKLSIKKRTLKVKGFPDKLPEDLLIDITDLEIHDSIKVGDLSFENIELLDPERLMVLTIATARIAMKTEEELEAEEEAEGTVEGEQEKEKEKEEEEKEE